MSPLEHLADDIDDSTPCRPFCGACQGGGVSGMTWKPTSPQEPYFTWLEVPRRVETEQQEAA